MNMNNAYNRRLFDRPGLRSYLHLARFRWFKRKVSSLSASRVIELGCFDGRLLEHFGAPVLQYEGFDAGWEGGLASAQERFRDESHLSFSKAETPEDIAHLANDSFDLGVAMETLEHIPPNLVDGYLQELARLVNGHVLFSVPNEKGPFLLAKWSAKAIMTRSTQGYTPIELWSGVRGRMDNVRRDDHKGFDYDALVLNVAKHFDVLSVESIPFARMPLSASFTVGIVARTKRAD